MSVRSGLRSHLLVGVLLIVAGRAFAAPATKPATAAPVPMPTEAVVETAQGRFVIRLLPELAPKHVKHFIKTAQAGGYDGTTFHRVIAGGLVQGGDPLSKQPTKSALYGTGGLGLLPAEFSERDFVRGSVGAARRPSSRDSGGSQFFVVLRDQPALKGQFTLFGEVVEGLDVLDQISLTPADGDKARTRVELRVTLRDDASLERGALPPRPANP
jgi:peptidyl-prolyl cis-trans isomerase B (cyclophilin B)